MWGWPEGRGGREEGAGWRQAKGRKMGTSIIVTTIKIKKKI